MLFTLCSFINQLPVLDYLSTFTNDFKFRIAELFILTFILSVFIGLIFKLVSAPYNLTFIAILANVTISIESIIFYRQYNEFFYAIREIQCSDRFDMMLKTIIHLTQ